MNITIRTIILLVVIAFLGTSQSEAINPLRRLVKREASSPKRTTFSIGDGNEYTADELKAMGLEMTSEIQQLLEEQGFDISLLNGPVFTPISDVTYEWSQFDNKKAKVVMSQEGLLLESKSDDQKVVSVAEFPFDPTDTSFEFGLSFTDTKAEEDKFVGFVIDYENDRNYKGFMVSKKDYMYFTVEKGELSIVNQGLVKPGKYIETIVMKRQRQSIDVTLNDMEIASINRVSITIPRFGIIIDGKTKAICNGFIFVIPEEETDSEQTTSDI